MKAKHVTQQKAVIFKDRFFVVIDPFTGSGRYAYRFTSSNFKMKFSFAIVSNIAITTLKFINNVRANITKWSP